MKKSDIIILLLAAALLGFGLMIFWYYGWYMFSYQETTYSFELVENNVGLLIDNSSLAFGNAAPGSKAIKHATIAAKHDARVLIRVSGNGVGYVTPDSYEYYLNASEPVTIPFTLATPKNASLGPYEGGVQFYFYRR